MLYSSGTTGSPQGRVDPVRRQADRDTAGDARCFCRAYTAPQSDSVYLSPAPLYHAAPLRFNMAMHPTRRDLRD